VLEDGDIDAKNTCDAIQYVEQVAIDNEYDVFKQGQIHGLVLQCFAGLAEKRQVDAQGLEKLLDDLKNAQQQRQESIRV